MNFKHAIMLALILLTPAANAALRGTPYIPEYDQRFSDLEDESGANITGDVTVTTLGVATANSSTVRKLVRAVWDPSTIANGGSSTVDGGVHSLGVSLPAKSIITNSYAYITTPPVSSSTVPSGALIGFECEDTNNILAQSNLSSIPNPDSTLGTAANFALLGGTAITNSGATVIANGDICSYPTTTITGFPPGVLTTGNIRGADAACTQAKTDLTTAYTVLAARSTTQDLSGLNLGGMTLTAGVYNYAVAAQLTGTLILDGQGNPNASFVFKIGSTLTTASGSGISLINGATASNVFFQVGSSATIGTSTLFQGNIVALTSITMNGGGSLNGRALARDGAVTISSAISSISFSPGASTLPGVILQANQFGSGGRTAVGSTALHGMTDSIAAACNVSARVSAKDITSGRIVLFVEYVVAE